MNFSSIFGVFFGVGVMYYALKGSNPDLRYFLDIHGILIVMGGTAAAASISFPVKKLFMLLKVFFLRVLGKRKVDYQDTITQILELSKRASNGLTGLKDSIAMIHHPFLKEAVSLVAAGVLTEKEIRHVLEQRVNTTEERYLHEANMFRSIGRFPPAFGLLATTLGMIGVLQRIGQPESQKLIGPAMSVGLIGTLYGIGLANLIFLPIAENLTERTREEITLRRLIIEGAVLIKQQVNPLTLRESLNSYVLPSDRVARKGSSAA